MPREMLSIRWFASMYNWTPDQVLELPVEYLEWFMPIEQAQARAERLMRDKKK